MTRQEAAALGCQANSAMAEQRIEDYQELRSWGLTREQAAFRLGVSMRTIERYEAALRAGA